MISKLTVKNFQCHEDFELELDPHVTIIVGESDKGKTALLRALRYAVLNRPGGISFISDSVVGDSGTVTVTIIADDTRVVRRRSSKSNVYRLGENRYVSFGAGKVPEPIRSLLNMDEVNFQTQHSPYFWFSDSPQQVSKSLNSIVDLGKIDQALASVAAAVRKARTRAEVCQERLDTAKKEQQELAWVPAFDADLSELEEQEATVQKQRERCSCLRALISNIVKAKAEANLPVPNIQRLKKQHNKVVALRTRADRLRELIDGITEAKRVLWRQQEKHKIAKQQLQKTELQEPQCPTCGQPLPSSALISTSHTPHR